MHRAHLCICWPEQERAVHLVNMSSTRRGALRHVVGPPCRPRCPSGRGAGGGARGARGNVEARLPARFVEDTCGACRWHRHAPGGATEQHGARRRGGALAGLCGPSWGASILALGGTGACRGGGFVGSETGAACANGVRRWFCNGTAMDLCLSSTYCTYAQK